MDNFNQIIFPAWMTSDHPVPLPTVKPILPAVYADGFFIASTQDDIEGPKVHKMNALIALANDIYTSTYLQNQKKEVPTIKRT